jgi:hypothetical protein
MSHFPRGSSNASANLTSNGNPGNPGGRHRNPMPKTVAAQPPGPNWNSYNPVLSQHKFGGSHSIESSDPKFKLKHSLKDSESAMIRNLAKSWRRKSQNEETSSTSENEQAHAGSGTGTGSGKSIIITSGNPRRSKQVASRHDRLVDKMKTSLTHLGVVSDKDLRVQRKRKEKFRRNWEAEKGKNFEAEVEYEEEHREGGKKGENGEHVENKTQDGTRTRDAAVVNVPKAAGGGVSKLKTEGDKQQEEEALKSQKAKSFLTKLLDEERVKKRKEEIKRLKEIKIAADMADEWLYGDQQQNYANNYSPVSSASRYHIGSNHNNHNNSSSYGQVPRILTPGSATPGSPTAPGSATPGSPTAPGSAPMSPTNPPGSNLNHFSPGGDLHTSRSGADLGVSCGLNASGLYIFGGAVERKKEWRPKSGRKNRRHLNDNRGGRSNFTANANRPNVNVNAKKPNTSDRPSNSNTADSKAVDARLKDLQSQHLRDVRSEANKIMRLAPGVIAGRSDRGDKRLDGFFAAGDATKEDLEMQPKKADAKQLFTDQLLNSHDNNATTDGTTDSAADGTAAANVDTVTTSSAYSTEEGYKETQLQLLLEFCCLQMSKIIELWGGTDQHSWEDDSELKINAQDSKL